MKDTLLWVGFSIVMFYMVFAAGLGLIVQY